MNRHHGALLLAGAVLLAGAGYSMGAAGDVSATDNGAIPAYKVVPHSDTQFAHQLLQLFQPSLIKAEEAASKGTASENMWRAQAIVAGWEEIAKSRADSNRATADYLAAMNAYLQANPEGVDGVWSLDHAKFIFGQLSQTVINRMEYFGNSPKDRAALAPMADLADGLLSRSSKSLEAATHYYEAKVPFDENAYTRASNAMAEVEYYNVWGQYFKAMAMEPGTKQRKDILLAAAETLGRWADDASDNGVNKQALLLRGKVRSEAGKFPEAVADLTKANDPAAPEWVRYQARYQIIVTLIRKHDFPSAMAEFDKFKKTLPVDNKVAQMSAEMLRYRILWTEAETKQDKPQKDEQLQALAILGEIIKTEPGFRDLIYEQLGSQIPDKAAMDDLLPMQQLAIAYSKSQGQKGDTPASRDQLTDAVKAAVAVRNNKSASVADKLEATYLAGVCSAVLNRLVDAVRFNVEFVEMAPKDPRAKSILELALSQIGELRKMPESQTPDVKALMERALALSTGTFNDPRFLYAQGMMLKNDGKLNEAAQSFAKIPPTDSKYIDARYQMVFMAMQTFNKLVAAKASEAEIGQAATDLFTNCGRFVNLLDNPPSTLPKEALESARAYRTDILIIKATTALNPSVKRPELAIDQLDKLDKVRATLPPPQQGTILKLRIQALQMSGAKTDEIMKVVDEYAKTAKQDPVEVMKGMAVSTIEEIRNIEKSDPVQAKHLADFVVTIFDPIIEQKAATDKKAAFELRELKADMMVRAGDYKGAQELCQKLQSEEPGRLSSFMTEARAMYAQAADTKDSNEYNKALDYFKRILPRLTPGNDVYWETWLHIIQCMEALKGPNASDEIKKKLMDLKASTSHLGGEAYKDDFEVLARKYGV